MKNIKLSIFTFLFSFGHLLSAQTPEELKSWLPPVDGWVIAEEIEIFNPDNLFDRINGAAPLYLENNFREMTSMEYKKGSDYITVQAYRHASPEDAFGMYSSERSSDMQFLPIGGEAQSGPQFFYFFAGNMYVKMQSNSQEDIEPILQVIGKGLADKIDPDADYPAVLKLFPRKGKIPYSESFITSSYIGHEFLKSVYVTKYENEGQSFQLFLIDGKTQEGAKNILNSYFTFTGQDLNFQESEFLIKDKYNGDIPALWKGRYIIGIFNENGDIIKNAGSWIQELSEKI